MKPTHSILFLGKILLGAILLFQTSCASKSVHLKGLVILKQSESKELQTTSSYSTLDITNQVDVSIKQGEKELLVSKGKIERDKDLDMYVVKTGIIPSEKLKMFELGKALIVLTITDADTGTLVAIVTQDIKLEP